VSPDGRLVASVAVARKGARGTQTIVVHDRRTGATRAVYRVRESYDRIPAGAPGPIVLYRWSGDGRWIFFAIDPQGSNSIAADGLLLQVVSASGGRPRQITWTLAYPDYLAWCSGRLVFTGGGDRLATTSKRLLVASPPMWRPRPLVNTPGRAWGSLACARDGRSVVVQSQRQSKDYSFLHTHWALWRVGLDGSTVQLTFPPASDADESPRFSRDGRTLLFVRSRNSIGRLCALRGKRLAGPLLSLGYSLGYYGHHDWWLTTDWSIGS
jgi:dipeptidyl aminopeptidase/acylaminoacyl peptidase